MRKCQCCIIRFVISTYGLDTRSPARSNVVELGRTRRHQQAAEELAGHVALDRHAPAAPAAALDDDRREAVAVSLVAFTPS